MWTLFLFLQYRSRFAPEITLFAVCNNMERSWHRHHRWGPDPAGYARLPQCLDGRAARQWQPGRQPFSCAQRAWHDINIRFSPSGGVPIPLEPAQNFSRLSTSPKGGTEGRRDGGWNRQKEGQCAAATDTDNPLTLTMRMALAKT